MPRNGAAPHWWPRRWWAVPILVLLLVLSAMPALARASSETAGDWGASTPTPDIAQFEGGDDNPDRTIPVAAAPATTAAPTLTPGSEPTLLGTADTDRAALVALYNATDGPNWTTDADNWLTDAPLGLWSGVGLDQDGRVWWLDLSNSALSGPIPAELGNLDRLEGLYLYSNALSGPIPAELGNLVNLRWLELAHNNLNGPIPAELGNLVNLRNLQLAHNNLNGPIPPELGNLVNLKWLELAHNNLNGPIPPELGNLDSLEYLYLHSNALSGPIPAELGNLDKLHKGDFDDPGSRRGLWLHDNYVRPCLPEPREFFTMVLDTEPWDGNTDYWPDCNAEPRVLALDEHPVIYNDNVFVLPVAPVDGRGELKYGHAPALFYEYFKDDFDFLAVISSATRFNWKGRYRAAYASVANATQGIGLDVFSRGRDLGSDGALQGLIQITTTDDFGVMRHELMHRWANYMPFGESCGGHWCFSSANGVLAGFDIARLVNHGDGRYSAGNFCQHCGIDGVYSPIELYLAGFIPPEEVPDLWVAQDGEWLDEWWQDDENDESVRLFTANGVRKYAIEDIIAEHGRRTPDSSQSQRHFRAAAILVVDEDHPPAPWQLDQLSDDIAWFTHAGNDSIDESNFYESTGGRATITMDGLSQFLKDDGPPLGSLGYSDMVSGGYFSEAVALLAADGVFAGTDCAAGSFCPGDAIDRKTVAVWIVRLLDGADPAAVTRSRFEDVEASGFHAPFIERMAELGVTKGCGDGSGFCPDATVSRAQMAAFLSQAFNLAGGADPGFSDVPAGAWYAADVARLAASGVSAGCGDGTRYCPDADTTRAQMATFLARATGRIELPATAAPTA